MQWLAMILIPLINREKVTCAMNLAQLCQIMIEKWEATLTDRIRTHLTVARGMVAAYRGSNCYLGSLITILMLVLFIAKL